MQTAVLEMTARLKELRLPKPKGSIYTGHFTDYLADQFKTETICPEEFLLEVELAFKALARGTDGSGEYITHRAVDRVPAAAFLIRMDLPDIIDGIFPADFAAEVKTVQKEVAQEALTDANRRL